jgi:hypothetical protein
MVNLRFEYTGKGLTAMDNLVKGNFRFAAVRAVTMLAKEAQFEIQRQMPTRFTMRRDWVQKGVRILAARVRNDPTTVMTRNSGKPLLAAQRDSREAVIYTLDQNFMRRQEFGGIKSPDRGSRLAIPTKNVLRTKSDIVRKSDLPDKIQNAFFIKSKRDPSMKLLVKRFKRGPRRNIEGSGLTTLYVLKKQAPIKKRLGLREISEEVIRAKASQVFATSLRMAVSEDLFKNELPNG